MKQPDVRAFLWDIRNGCELLENIAATKTFDEYTADVILRMAVERQFEIIAEALKNVLRTDPAVGARITAAPQILAFRNRIAHDYWRVIGATVWAVMHDHVPVLHREVAQILDQLPPPGSASGPTPA
jgi:uncharacterized protein with HEPN domain